MARRGKSRKGNKQTNKQKNKQKQKRIVGRIKTLIAQTIRENAEPASRRRNAKRPEGGSRKDRRKPRLARKERPARDRRGTRGARPPERGTGLAPAAQRAAPPTVVDKRNKKTEHATHSRPRAFCKARPTDNRSKGGNSATFIPWCERRN